MAGTYESKTPPRWDSIKRGFVVEREVDADKRATANTEKEAAAKPAPAPEAPPSGKNIKQGAGGWSYQFNEDGSIEIVGAPAGHKAGAVLTGGAAYDAIKREFGDVSRVTDPKKVGELRGAVAARNFKG